MGVFVWRPVGKTGGSEKNSCERRLLDLGATRSTPDSGAPVQRHVSYTHIVLSLYKKPGGRAARPRKKNCFPPGASAGTTLGASAGLPRAGGPGAASPRFNPQSRCAGASTGPGWPLIWRQASTASGTPSGRRRGARRVFPRSSSVMLLAPLRWGRRTFGHPKTDPDAANRSAALPSRRVSWAQGAGHGRGQGSATCLCGWAQRAMPVFWPCSGASTWICVFDATRAGHTTVEYASTGAGCPGVHPQRVFDCACGRGREVCLWPLRVLARLQPGPKDRRCLCRAESGHISPGHPWAAIEHMP
ncbi:hypothetical protein METBIDRAFT_152968 [Metschnikowia bicuspidata var. bicuspidata NRRL YB-4993]|uniref:Uncharacterized protein n=1 Tax=Metschnikowia bicuspidata var. bicuspidata NRRL YB-4993 TaxID=869754 RepID=A0A1A0HEI8_9ASCO|nr:hypothetical protein METBIDRAFT_152968 [Metschnikowia bicuspidata var. bicuspidata NRRL YB-4993]OBA22400.1 hypothetical protein METBIDRAFT_152968 [Metschnikowia bicuspidata var. bicuspidata NRRL YB-4993]